MPELTVLEAVREALAEEMARDDRVLVFGEDVATLGGVFRATDGLLATFGPERVVDMPMAETAIAGLAVGLAMRGLRPVAEIQFADFIHACMDHLVGEAAKIRWRTNGDWSCPMVLRTAYGGGFRGGPYHSQSVEAYYAHAPGLKVVAPSTPADAKGLLRAAIRDPNPVIFLENEILYGHTFDCPVSDDFILPIGKAKVEREGTDVTIVAFSIMVDVALKAAEALAEQGISAEVINLRTIRPLDVDTIVASVKKTNRVVSVEEGWPFAGIGAEIAMTVTEHCFDWLDAPPMRVAGLDVPMPYAANLEKLALPQPGWVVDAVKKLF